MKQILSALIILAMLLTLGISSAAAYTPVADSIVSENERDMENILYDEELTGIVYGYLGDADTDETITIKDATSIQKHLADIEELGICAQLLSDVDRDERITVKDATAIQKWLAGIEVNSPVFHTLYMNATIDEAIIGEWYTEYDAANDINDAIASSNQDDALLIEHVNISTFPIEQIYTFCADGTYIISCNETVMAESIANMKTELAGDFTNYFEALSAELELGLTAEQMITAMGYASVEEIVNEMFTEEFYESLSTPYESGYFAANGDLFMDGSGVDLYENYIIEGDTLTITGNTQGLYPEIYPIMLNKAG
ncbi:MAG: dockerin type I repeat-containing protein [Clostridia bacterium]|nr:dockerin type I repeat-containing protein [Clostridia bacterium]